MTLIFVNSVEAVKQHLALGLPLESLEEFSCCHCAGRMFISEGAFRAYCREVAGPLSFACEVCELKWRQQQAAGQVA